ncbi:recombinase zinc beta ribbon domain-containing protein [Acetobacterium carbinolicum]|uniref:recombinase zinc beta ribbon domain-containing protein n=1 Tax=Acetobacterium carbinolicum TaxID=52690 RepID=UPI0039C903F6
MGLHFYDNTPILQNEKYKGDAVLQKTYTVDFLTKKKKSNEGEVPQYYVENSHPAIISPEVYDLVQHELKKRKQEKGYKTSGSPFSGQIVCGECGSFYGSKVWHSTSKYRRVIWQCNHKFDHAKKCQTPHLYEEELKRTFVDGFNKHIENKEEIVRNYEATVKVIFNTKDLEKELLKHQNDYQMIVKEIQILVDENASTAQDQSAYQEQYNLLVEKYEHTKNRMVETEGEIKDKTARRLEMKEFINRLKKTEEILTQFDEELFLATIEKIIVQADSKIVIVFKDGAKIELMIKQR